jgi:hypothetical protein
VPLIDFDSRSIDRNRNWSQNASSTGDVTLPAAGIVLGGPVAVARVDHGRWIADCPTDGCGGAEFVSLSGQPFFCCECRNAATGHMPIPVALPPAKTVAQIDAYLSARPAPATRNWRPEETVAALRAENRANGIRLKKGD